MAVILLPGQSAAYSSSVIVAADETKLISIYTDTNGVDIPTGVDLTLERTNAAGNWQEVYDIEYGKIKLSSRLFDIVLTAVGTYRIKREDITAYGVNVGVAAE